MIRPSDPWERRARWFLVAFYAAMAALMFYIWQCNGG